MIDGLPLIATFAVSTHVIVSSPTPETMAALSGLWLAVVTAWWAYMTVATWRSASVGKRILGLRVVTRDGTRPAFRAAFVREGLVKVIAPTMMVGVVLPVAMPAIPLLLAVPALWHRSERLFAHDVLAGTMVVDARAGDAA